MTATKLFLFDLDGTLVTTGGAGMRALTRAFNDLFGVENASDHVDPAGKTDPAIFRELVRIFLDREMTAADLEKITAAYLIRLDEQMRQPAGSRVLPGVAAFLEHLTTRPDILMALGTGNLERGARLKLAPMALNGYFSFGGFGSDAEDRAELLLSGYRRALERAPGLQKSDVWVLGDTALDIAAAQRAGFRSVGVATGRTSVERLRDAGADHALSDLTHGPNFLADLDASMSAA